MATRSDEAFYRKLFTQIVTECGLESFVDANPEVLVETTLRENAKGRFLFLLNHGEKTAEVTLKMGGTDLLGGKKYEDGAVVALEAKGVAVLELS